jgi:hypothetical protein
MIIAPNQLLEKGSQWFSDDNYPITRVQHLTKIGSLFISPNQ